MHLAYELIIYVAIGIHGMGLYYFVYSKQSSCDGTVPLALFVAAQMAPDVTVFRILCTAHAYFIFNNMPVIL
jgi:hypothetical protein